jgi:urease accessory protein
MDQRLGLISFVGIAAAAFTVVTFSASLVVSLRPAWARVAVRVGGSWVAASGLLMLGWHLSGQK